MKRLACILVVAACGGGSDANVAGNYTMAITNRDNGCNFSGYNVGDQNQVQVMITQNDSNLSATVTGGGGFLLALVVGSNVYTGSVDGNDVDVKIVGTRAFNDGNCAFTYDSEIKSTAHDNSMDGRIEYRAVTNNNSDCATHTGCLTFQEFAGSRPPPP
jgi:hypothetical protein